MSSVSSQHFKLKLKTNEHLNTKFSINNKTNNILETIIDIFGQKTEKIYVKKGFLGKGGFANCYITQQVGSDREMATKIISKANLCSNRSKMRLMNEIKIHKTFRHQNIVELYHYFEDPDNVYIMMELCENQSLNDLMRQRETFTTPQIQSFLYGICNGVKYLHSRKFIHRDLKLGNIFLNKQFQIKVGDFGLASQLQFLKENKRTVCGTPNYIAPEILQGTGYYFQVDIWAIGIILYTLYYGFPPFQSELTAQIYTKIRNCSYTFPKKNRNVPKQAISLISRILVMNPVQRPSLDDILESPFMRLGQSIPLQLPEICSIREPTYAELCKMRQQPIQQRIKQWKQNHEKSTNDYTLFRNTTELEEKVSCFHKKSTSNLKEMPSTEKQQIEPNILPNLFMRDYQVISKNQFYFCTSELVLGVYSQGNAVFFRPLKAFETANQYIWQLKINNNMYCEKKSIVFNECTYKVILSVKANELLKNKKQHQSFSKSKPTHHRSASNPILTKSKGYQLTNNTKPVNGNRQLEQTNNIDKAQFQKENNFSFVSKVSSNKGLNIIRMSNKNIQILFDDSYDGFVLENRSNRMFYFPKLHFTDQNAGEEMFELDSPKIPELLIINDANSKLSNFMVKLPILSNNRNLSLAKKKIIKIPIIKIKYLWGIAEELKTKKNKHVKNRHSQ